MKRVHFTLIFYLRSGKRRAMYAVKASLALVSATSTFLVSAGWTYWIPSSSQLGLHRSPSLWQKLWRPQHAAIIVGANVKWKSLLFARTLKRAFKSPKLCSTPTRTALKYILNDSCCGVRFGEVWCPFISQLSCGYAGSPTICSLTSTPSMFLVPCQGGGGTVNLEWSTWFVVFISVACCYAVYFYFKSLNVYLWHQVGFPEEIWALEYEWVMGTPRHFTADASETTGKK